MKKIIGILLLACGIGVLPCCGQSGGDKAAKPSGGISPEAALEYMKTTKNIVVVDVAAKRWYAQEHFEGAINIPIENLSSDEAKKLYLAIPKDRPVLLHCRLGMIVPGAYRTLKQLRPDISEICYIDGVPPFDEYNKWLKQQK